KWYLLYYVAAEAMLSYSSPVLSMMLHTVNPVAVSIRTHPWAGSKLSGTTGMTPDVRSSSSRPGGVSRRAGTSAPAGSGPRVSEGALTTQDGSSGAVRS